MIYELTDQGYRAQVTRLGAELLSYQDPEGEHYIWQRQPAVWDGSAPILFPVIGRLKAGRYQWQGQWYELPKHGLVRARHWELIQHTPACVELCTRSDAETRLAYPFDYDLRVRFELTGPLLRVSYQVLAAGETVLPFNFGSHPALALPLNGQTRLADYSLHFNQAEAFEAHRLEQGLLSREKHRVAEFESDQCLRLSETLFEPDALILRHIRSDQITLIERHQGPRVRLHTGGTPHLGVWAKPGANYVCLEPWFGHDDWLDTEQQWQDKDQLITLAAGEQFDTAYQIEILS